VTGEQKRRLEELRELAIQIERLYGNRETVRSPAGKAAILRDIRTRKRERRGRVRALYDDGVAPSVIATAAGLTRSAVRRPARA
jgi:DNA invertase Pin-like site-specific DNA recombinase